MLRQFLTEIDGINLVDIGSSGSLDARWKPLERHINLVGFDPNGEECARMEALPHNFRSVKYLPYAIAGEIAKKTLHKTKSIYCYSLLEPNTDWLRRFSFGDLFERTGEEPLETKTLSSVPEIQGMDVDVLKIDVQGVELPILRQASQTLHAAFMVETESGFVENYRGESTYSQIDDFMRSKNFLLFDLNTSHRIPRNNVFKDIQTNAEQLMWCEAVWLKDYIAIAKNNALRAEDFGREKVLKILTLCAFQGCIDYGYEIASLAQQRGVLTSQELVSLESRAAWLIADDGASRASKSSMASLISFGLRLLPKGVRKIIKREVEQSLSQNHRAGAK